MTRDARRPLRAVRTTMLAVVLIASGLVALRAPHDVVALVTGRSTRAVPTAAVPTGTEVASVTAVDDRRPQGAAAVEGPAPGADSGEGSETHGVTVEGGTPQGRWGPPAPRPGTTGIVLEELRGGWRISAGIEEAVALAVVSAHAWAAALTADGAPPRTGGEVGVVVTVEAVEQPGALHAVVTLLVATPPTLHRLAVPVVLDHEGPAVAGAPWLLPSPRATVRPLTGTPTGDPQLITAARVALERAGIDGGRLTALEVTDGWPFIARLDDDADGHPWLRWHLDRFVVTGLPLDAVGDG